jgi:gas vesicle protein
VTILKYLKDEKLIKTLEHYQMTKNRISTSLQPSIKDQFESWSNTLSKSNITIPVLGVQGAGKSTLLNALIMQNKILPVDDDETTCIPIEIVYARGDSEFAEIVFEDGNNKEIPCTEEDLYPFVNNIENLGENKKIKFIRIKRKNDLLKNGVIFVDLPGFDKLTERNFQTAMNYIVETSAAIFLLRTVPPITQSELIFIQSIWPTLSQVFFIQNQWYDETLDEVNDGKQHNQSVLKQMAERCHISKADITIDVVNVSNAFYAKVENHSAEIKKSGITAIQKKIINFVKSWRNQILLNIKDNLTNSIAISLKNIDNQIDSIDNDDFKNELSKRREEFEEEYNYKKQKIEECFAKIREAEKMLKNQISEAIKNAKDNFRNNIRTVINSGVTDGKNLQQAFNDIQKEQVTIIFEKIQPLYQDFISEIQFSFSEIPDFSFQKISKKYATGIEHKAKWETIVKPVGSALGGAGGLAGGILVTAKIGAVLGTPFGPIGTAIGAAIGSIVGGIIGLWSGSKISKMVIKNRSKSTQKQIFPIVEEWKKELEKELHTQLKNLFNNTKETVNNWMKKAKDEFDSNEQQLQDNVYLSDSKKKNKEKIISER